MSKALKIRANTLKIRWKHKIAASEGTLASFSLVSRSRASRIGFPSRSLGNSRFLSFPSSSSLRYTQISVNLLNRGHRSSYALRPQRSIIPTRATRYSLQFLNPIARGSRRRASKAAFPRRAWERAF